LSLPGEPGAQCECLKISSQLRLEIRRHTAEFSLTHYFY
jgi:hypothetical protein